MKNALVIMAKRPLLGQTKTRLTPPLAPEQAAELYACFLRDTIDLARQVSNVYRLIAFAPIDARDYFAQLAPDFLPIPQMGHDLGERLANVMSECLGNAWERLVIMDSDSPTLPAPYVANAFDALGKADVVLGPCVDGGYYLIGVKRPQPRLVREVKMSTSNVLRDTLAIAREENLTVALTERWYDIDTANELEQLRKELRSAKNGTGRYTRKFLETR
jgi:rSAM/selenodomain-associated transferase 1